MVAIIYLMRRSVSVDLSAGAGPGATSFLDESADTGREMKWPHLPFPV